MFFLMLQPCVCGPCPPPHVPIQSLYSPSSHQETFSDYIEKSCVIKVNVLSRVGVAHRQGFGLDDGIYCTIYIHRTRDNKQYSAILFYTLSSSPFHAHYDSQSSLAVSWHFKSCTESSFCSLVFFLTRILQLQILKTQRNSIPLLPSSYPGRPTSCDLTRLELTWFDSIRLLFSTTLSHLKVKVMLRPTVQSASLS
jgi:hypothetical protein